MLPVPERGALGRRGTGPVLRRADDQGPPCLQREVRPLAFTLTGGNTNDCTQFEPVMDRIVGVHVNVPSYVRMNVLGS